MNGAIRPDPPLPASPIDGVVRALGWALLAGIALYAAHAVGLLAGGTTFFAAYLHTGLFVAAAAICLVRAGVSPHDRAAWTLVGAGIACWAAGNAAWDIAVAGGPSPASPSPADVYWLLFYLAAYPALFLLVRARIGGIHASAWMDGLLAALSTAALLAAFVVVPLADHTGGTRHEVATTLAYPVLDAVLVIECVVAATLAGRRAGRGLWAAAAALALFTAADAIFAYTVAAGTYDGDGLINIVWPVGMAIIALIAWRTRAQRPVVVASAPALTMSVLLIPFTFAAAAAALLAYGNVAGLSPLAVWLAAAAVAVGLARTALGFREVVGAAETRRQAMTDELTGLANRRHLERELDRAVHAAEATGGRVVFLLIDLDGFKEVNDTLGHKAGDALLRRIGPRLRGAIGPGHLLARLGGDEFGILMPGASDPAATGMAQEVRLRLQEAFALEGLSIAIDASVGIAAYPEEAASPDELIQHADVAMYQAKGTRTGVQRYEARRNPHSRDRLALLGGLRAALVRGEVVPHYQPQADAVTGEVVAMEALARWHHPERGVLTPAVFLPHAEQSALMRPLTLAMLERALADVVAWRAAGAEVGVAVNLSVVNLIDERLPGDVRRCLSAAGARPEWLELEITENVVMTDPARACEVLGELRDVGVSVALDDYGTGQASLAWLKRLPVDVLKIDRSFVKDVASDLQSAAIVRSAVDLARAFGLRTVAEGVEDAACLRRAAELGCDLVQGYAIARPLDGAAAAAFLAAGEAPAAPPPTLGAPAIPLRHAAGPHGHRAHGAG